MAMPRMFNSNFIATEDSDLSLPGRRDNRGCEEEKGSQVQAISPHLKRVMLQGTAKHVEGPRAFEENPDVSIVAQAEREDFQEFSPTPNAQLPYLRSQLLRKHRSVAKGAVLLSDTDEEDSTAQPHHLQRKQRRKSRGRANAEDGQERPIIQGLWVQEIDWLRSSSKEMTSCDIIPPPPQFTDSYNGKLSPLCSSCEDKLKAISISEDQYRLTDTSLDRGDSDWDYEQDSESNNESDSSYCVEDCKHCNAGLQGMPDHTSNVNFGADDMDKMDGVLEELRGRVTHMPKMFAMVYFEDVMRQSLREWNSKSAVNEGLLFHNALQPRSFQYREGREYCVLHHIQNGSYGDVFSIQDKRTGFSCAAKRIPISRFSSEEVNTWSAQDSPRIVELFGAVREGPHIVLFMDLKPACLGTLLKEMNSLPEDLALHYLLQTLEALEHLHSIRVLHLDVKVDNVLLSADCTHTFLCDFGLSETLDDNGWSTKAFRGSAFPGTETHMAPEVAQGDQLCAKADVWSSCCMLLHMLNGCQPWIRYYSHPLCLQIANEPPPLWEVPSNCNNFTAKVFRAGLKKDPDKRSSAKSLRKKTTKALRAVGGLSPWSIKIACEKLYSSKKPNNDNPSSLLPECPCPSRKSRAPLSPTMHWVSPWREVAADEDSDGSHWETTSEQDCDVEPKSLINADENDWDTGSESSEVDIYMGEEEYTQEKWLKFDRDYEGDWEEDGEVEEEEDEELSTENFRDLKDVFPVLQKGQTQDDWWGSEEELEYLRDGVSLGNTVQPPSPEPRDDPPSCFSCSDSSQIDASDNDSDRSSDDLSSGVFSSCNSQADGYLQWTASPHQPSSYCFEGVDIWIEDIQGQCLRIREQRQVKVGHVAIGISNQISEEAFTLVTLDRKLVSFEQEIKASGLWLRCVPAPNRCQRWNWRVKHGKLELRE
ncbi:mitogen-activated protein kinase kinase kinase 14 isoform X2 [Boleophthalmus pectinirostris]|uniref:mitogen-activated protein kinase kinase kinase 14 isoform X2 n=1 Tax=Boleophthalmus pectinirostris TaxID=150288 RepID=UPI00242D4C35|nr:mitogen-activated protein kinase kinase kinase 14 isoform X2 [Boleophthalmus pectinirostris]